MAVYGIAGISPKQATIWKMQPPQDYVNGKYDCIHQPNYSRSFSDIASESREDKYTVCGSLCAANRRVGIQPDLNRIQICSNLVQMFGRHPAVAPRSGFAYG